MLDRYDILYVLIGAVIVYLVLAYRRLLPSVDSLQSLATVANTKGGNILVLLFLTLVFFFTGIGLIYWSLNRMVEGKLSADNAVLMMGLSFVLGTAFGGSFSSMLKVMSGEDPKPTPGTTTTSTTSVATGPGTVVETKVAQIKETPTETPKETP